MGCMIERCSVAESIYSIVGNAYDPEGACNVRVSNLWSALATLAPIAFNSGAHRSALSTIALNGS